jgi:hypothetical protein
MSWRARFRRTSNPRRPLKPAVSGGKPTGHGAQGPFARDQTGGADARRCHPGVGAAMQLNACDAERFRVVDGAETGKRLGCRGTEIKRRRLAARNHATRQTLAPTGCNQRAYKANS